MKHKRVERDYLDRCYSLAVLGGTFDPIHIGHLTIAEAVCQQLKPQRVLFMPCGQPAHKHDRQIIPPEHRYNMTVLATCDHPSFDVSRMELDRQGPSYTIDTAHALQAICPTGAEIYFIVGADALGEILSWKEAEDLLRLCNFVAVPRPGYDKVHGLTHTDYLTRRYNGRFCWLDSPMIDISSTAIRKRFTAGQPVRGLVPKIVEDYIWRHRLYRDDNNFTDRLTSGVSSFNDARDKLRVRLSPKRFTHTMGVVEEAERLATHYTVDIEKARWAALLHDCAKEYSADKKRALCKLWGIQLDEVLEANIDIAHSMLGAESARRDFYINDPAILQAIRYHTTGHKGMTMLDKIIMLADYIEPYREDWGPLKEMRSLAFVNINQALIIGTKYTIKEEEEAGNPIHPWSCEALKELKRQKEEHKNGNGL